MLLVYLQEYDLAALRELTELCRECFDLNWDARVQAGVQAPDELTGQITGDDLPALFILEDTLRIELDKAVSEIRKRSALHYLVLRISEAMDALLVRPAYYRASGFLPRPLDKDFLRRLLESIYRDFTASTGYGGFFSLKVRGTLYRLPYEKIVFFESADKKIIARTSAQEYEFYDSLEEISRAAPDFFLRVHRGFCVNVRQIDALNLSEKTITMLDGSVLPFSRTFRQELISRCSDTGLI